MIGRKSIWIIAFLVLICPVLSAEDPIVYITKTGEKYHTSTCSYLKKPKIPISLSNAIRQGYTPCSRCNPPILLPTQTPGPADDEVLGTIERSDNCREDPHLPTGSASLEDYRGSGYDRGHLAPAADMKWSEEVMRDSFFMSNISPQRPGFNRRIWRKLEEWVRDQAEANEEVYVVTGPILVDGPYEEFCIVIHFGKRNLPWVKTCPLWEKRG